MALIIAAIIEHSAAPSAIECVLVDLLHRFDSSTPWALRFFFLFFSHALKESEAHLFPIKTQLKPHKLFPLDHCHPMNLSDSSDSVPPELTAQSLCS